MNPFLFVSQGWLILGSALFRPNPDGVTVDGKGQSCRLHSLCVSQFTWAMDLTPPRGSDVCVCVCERGEINTALIRMYGAQGPTSKCKEGGGKRRRNGPWGGWREEELEDTSVKSPRTHFTKLPALHTPYSVCAVCLRMHVRVCVYVWLCNSTGLADDLWFHPGLIPLSAVVNLDFVFWGKGRGRVSVWIWLSVNVCVCMRVFVCVWDGGGVGGRWGSQY